MEVPANAHIPTNMQAEHAVCIILIEYVIILIWLCLPWYQDTYPPDIHPRDIHPPAFYPFDFYPLGPPLREFYPLGLLPPRISTSRSIHPLVIYPLGHLPPKQNLVCVIETCTYANVTVGGRGVNFPRG